MATKRVTAYGFYLRDSDGHVRFVPKGTPYSESLAEAVSGNPNAWTEVEEPDQIDDLTTADTEPEDSEPEPEDSDDAEPSSDDAPEDEEAVEPPARNASTDEWVVFAEHHGFDVPDDVGRDDIIAALEDRDVIGG